MMNLSNALSRLSPEQRAKFSPEFIESLNLSDKDRSQVNAILQEFNRRDREERLREFVPLRASEMGHKGHPCNDQWGFITNPSNERWVFGGNRSGKTEVVCADALMFAMGEHPLRSMNPKIRVEVPEGWHTTVDRKDAPVHIRMVGPSYEDGVKRILHKKIKQLVPRDALVGDSWDKAYVAGERTLYFKNGSTVNFKSYEQDVNKFGGDDLDAVYGDEHGSQAHYRENKMRLIDRNGFYCHSMTPELGAITWERQHVMRSNNPERAYWMFTTYGNIHLSLKGLEEVESSIKNESARKVKLFGMFIPLSGLVYPMVDEAIHFIEFQTPPEWWPRAFILDPHLKKEHAMIWAALSPEGDLYVYRCAKINGTPSQLKAYIRVRSMGENIVVWIGDKAHGGDKVDNFGNESILNELNKGENRIPIVGTNQEAEEPFQAGVEITRDFLEPNPTTGQPKIHFLKPVCAGVMDEFYEYQFMPETKTDELTFRERVRHVYDDYMSCVRYLCVWANKYKGSTNTNFVTKHSGKW